MTPERSGPEVAGIGAPPPASRLDAFAEGSRRAGRELVVGALVVDARGRVFVQRRSEDRAIFPGAWDIVGGHAEPGEGVRAALARELREETGWRLTALGAEVMTLDWEANGRAKREIDLLVRATGDLTRPRLEPAKHTGFRWLEPPDLPLLLEARDPDDTFVFEVVRRGFARLASFREG